MSIGDLLATTTDAQHDANQVVGSPFSIATVFSGSSSSARLIFPGDENPTATSYPVIRTALSLYKGDRVLVAKVGGSFVILGKF